LQAACAEWQTDILPQQLPPSRGNAYADREDAAALGMRIFYDNRFSEPSSGVSCASCHDPEHSFSETKPRSHTLKEVRRNAPDLINAAWYSRAHFWDGKVDNVWSAPLFTFEQSDEMGSSRLHVIHTLASIYKTRYEKIFGPLPDLSETGHIPATGMPGTPAYDGLTAPDKSSIDKIYANIGKALEAYIRRLSAGRSPFDDFMAGSATSMTPAAQHGMVAFTRYGCHACHSGPTFSDEDFHDLHLPKTTGLERDPGRQEGKRFSRKWQFNSTGSYADPPPGGPLPTDARPSTSNGFRTPSLRNVALTAPYGHDGTLATLEDAIDAHQRVLPGGSPIRPEDKRDIIEFLRALSGRPPQPPWNYWPGG